MTIGWSMAGSQACISKCELQRPFVVLHNPVDVEIFGHANGQFAPEVNPACTMNSFFHLHDLGFGEGSNL